MNDLKKIFAALFLLFVFTFANAANENDTTQIAVEKWLTAGPVKISKPAFAGQKDLHGKKFNISNLLKSEFKKIEYPVVNNPFTEGKKWRETATDTSGTVNVSDIDDKGYYLFWQTVYFHVKEFTKLEIIVKTRQGFEMYVDKKKKLSSYSATAKNKDIPEKTKTLNLEPGRHVLLIKSLYEKDTSNTQWNIKVSYSIKNKAKNPSVNLLPETFMDMDHLMNGKRLSSVSISPDGNYYMCNYRETFPPDGKTQRWSEIIDAETEKTVFSSKFGDISSIKWTPCENCITFTAKRGNDKYLIKHNLTTQTEKILMKLPKKFDDYHWADKGDFIVYSVSDKLKRDKSGVYKLEGMPDRWPWYRSRSQLFILNTHDLSTKQLTYGHLTCNLQDISPDGKKILFTQSIPQYSERPYYKQIVLQMNLETLAVDTLWSDNFSAGIKYSPDGKKLLVTGSAAIFNNAGVNLKKGKIPNDYDTQAYIYDLTTKSIEPITKNFNPAVISAHWNAGDNNIYFLAEDRTYRNIWRYNTTDKTFEALPVKTDVVNGFSFSEKTNKMVYSGSSISYPATGYIMDLNTENQKLISDPSKEFFKNVKFGKTEDWTFKNKNGLTIDGRIYYPPDFDSDKKYPLIVYYYGGTSPTSRSFGGRYPKNLFAAHGYVVYVLQPSGATGYGQDFSALHVNGWGKENATDIIEGTKKFLKTHSFIDKNAVGCIGASYGGYMTMYLQTQTDIFSAAIAHAGISSISSYWGEGYWGYLYSSVASANSFPWNNKKLYVDHSPLFNADKVKTPILLLHGTADTNVPTGESIQFYTALKLLGKPVELVEIEGQNHHITDYKKRIRWQKTILAWFDKYLKHQNDWWKNLYPDKNL